MDNQFEYEYDDAAMRRRRKRREEMRRKKRQQMLFRKYFKFGAAALLLLLCVVTIVHQKSNKDKEEVPVIEDTKTENLQETEAESMIASSESVATEMTQHTATYPEENKVKKTYHAVENSATDPVDEEVNSTGAILIDLSTDTILASRNAKKIIDPASMTKVLTVLVAAEQIKEAQLNDTFTITIDITDYAYRNDCSAVGFAENETVTVKDLFYGTILPSGGDAAVALATYVAGSQEAFVEMMNEKLEELGLSATAHFTNCVGLYNEEHYCSAYDMAMILEAALDNPLCKEVLSAHTYTTTKTTEHPDGITISNWFLRRIEDKDSGGVVLCGKTGYVVQSGNCAASYAEDANGNGYICVTVNAHSGWRCIYDHVALYHKYMS